MAHEHQFPLISMLLWLLTRPADNNNGDRQLQTRGYALPWELGLGFVGPGIEAADQGRYALSPFLVSTLLFDPA